MSRRQVVDDRRCPLVIEKESSWDQKKKIRSNKKCENEREGDGWYRPQHAGSKPRGTRGAIPLSSILKGGDPK